MTFCLIVLDCGFSLLLSVTSGGGQKAWRSAGWWLDMEEWCRDQGQLGVLLMSDAPPPPLHLRPGDGRARLHCCIVNMFECYHTSPHTARPPQASTQQRTFQMNWVRNLWQTPGCVSVSADMKHRSWCALGWAAHFLWCAVWERCTLHTSTLLPAPHQHFSSSPTLGHHHHKDLPVFSRILH